MQSWSRALSLSTGIVAQYLKFGADNAAPALYRRPLVSYRKQHPTRGLVRSGGTRVSLDFRRRVRKPARLPQAVQGVRVEDLAIRLLKLEEWPPHYCAHSAFTVRPIQPEWLYLHVSIELHKLWRPTD